MEGKVPASMQVECSKCGTETLHRTLKGRFAGKKRLDMVLKCSECGNVREERFELASQVEFRLIISRGNESERTQMEMRSDWVVSMGDEFMHEDEKLLVTGIEAGGKRVRSAKAHAVETLWTKNYDTIQVHVSVNRRGHTRALVIDTEPEEEFEVGSDIEIDGKSVLVHSIKTDERKMRQGTAQARDIVRIYCTDNRSQRPKFRRP